MKRKYITSIVDAGIAIENMMEGGKLEKPLTSPCELLEVFENFSKLDSENGITTICSNVAAFYRKYKFNVQPEGIGWRINCQ